MEEIPNNNEQAERREWLVANLKERGYRDSGVQEVMQAWFKEQEKNRRPEPGSEIDDTIEYALLLKDAGLRDEAREALEDALKNAWMGFQNEDMCAKIEGIMATL